MTSEKGNNTKALIIIALITTLGSIAVAFITTNATIRQSSENIESLTTEANLVTEKLKDVNVPIGTIVPSLLTPGEFAQAINDPAVFNPKRNKWVVCDKEIEITGSKYANLKNVNRTPDLRGMFLRGLNLFSGGNIRKDGNQDPSDPNGTRNAGEYQADVLKNHVHYRNSEKLEENVQGGSGNVSWMGQRSSVRFLKYTKSGNVVGETFIETRPKNVGVFYYLRIN